MVLNNFKNWFKMAINNKTMSGGGIGYTGQSFNMGTGAFLNTIIKSTNYISSSSTCFTVLYGKGKTAPTLNDYAMEDIITEGWEHTSLTVERTNDATVVIDVITNNGTEDIELNELGLNAKVGSSSVPSRLMFREVFDKPITLKPNDIYTFIIKLALA